MVEVWRAKRSVQESQCLKKYFEQVMDPIVDFILNKAGWVHVSVNFTSLTSTDYYAYCDDDLSRQGAVYSEVGLLETCLAYLTTLLNV